MRRLVIILAIVISQLALIAIAVLWVRSYRIDEPFGFTYHGKAFRIVLRAGATVIDNVPEIVAQSAREERYRKALDALPGATLFLGMFGGSQLVDPPTQVPSPWSKSSRIPLPVLAALLLVGPWWTILKWHKRRRRFNRGLCIQCAYNLTGNMTGICPECGCPVAKGRQDLGSPLKSPSPPLPRP